MRADRIQAADFAQFNAGLMLAASNGDWSRPSWEGSERGGDRSVPVVASLLAIVIHPSAPHR